MHRRRKFRGISLGTLLSLVLTVCVCAGFGYVFPRLMADIDVSVDTTQVLQALNLDGLLPDLQPALTDAPTEAETPSVPVAETPQPSPVVTAAPVTATPAPGGSFTLTIGGSVNLDDAVRKSGYYSDSDKYHFDDVFSLITEELQSDYVILSLENLIMPQNKVSALNAPPAILDTLRDAGVDLMGLGFPQVYEKGSDGLTSTRQAAADAQLSVFGPYSGGTELGHIHMTTLGGVKVAFIHYTDLLTSVSKNTLKKDGAYIFPEAEDQVVGDVNAVRSAGAEVVLVYMNWGSDGKGTPTSDQRSLAQTIAKAGADVIVGTGSNVVQTAEWLDGMDRNNQPKKVLCVYSLGSLLNESRKDGNVASILLHLDISCDGSGVRIDRAAYTPTYIWRYSQDSKYYYRIVASDQPAPYGMSDDQGKNKERALENIQEKLQGTPLTIR